MKTAKRLAMLGIAVLLVTLIQIAPQATNDIEVYHTAVNDRMLIPLTTASMPVAVGGTVYVPYTVFDKNVTEVDLGVYYGQVNTSTTYTLTLYSADQFLTFDLNAGSCVDQRGTVKNMQAIIRHGKVYVPANAVCSYFGLNYTLFATEYGNLVRITNESVVLNGTKFLNSAMNLMRNQYNEYVAGVSVTPAPSPAPSPSPSVVPSSGPSPSQEPEIPAADKSAVRVYLAFHCVSGEGLGSILDTLDRERVVGLFLFSVDDIKERAEEIRRMAGSGHTVGILLPEEDTEQAAELLEQGTELLEEIARLRVHAVYVPGADEELLEALTEAGWYCWQGNIDETGGVYTTSYGLSNAVMQAVAARRSVARVTMDDSVQTGQALLRIFSALREDRYQVSHAVETAF